MYLLMDDIKVLRTFIKYEFKNLPGTAWVDQGRYLMFNLTNDQILNEHNWGSTVVPGTAVAMSMLLQERFVSSLNLKEQRCPKSTCSGTWTRPETQSWVTCEALVRNAWNDPDSSNGSDFEPYSAINPSVAQRGVDTHSRKRIVEKTPHLDDDIAVFKRVVQQFVAESKTNLSILRRGKDVIAWGPKEREEIRKKEKKKIHGMMMLSTNYHHLRTARKGLAAANRKTWILYQGRIALRDIRLTR
ncbi:hypothetical protein F4782DRAFT_464511 [Xylaria castorea]|nr:hypothetical protein F4782DRAFT_464511 [Xylaria castorea]